MHQWLTLEGDRFMMGEKDKLVHVYAALVFELLSCFYGILPLSASRQCIMGKSCVCRKGLLQSAWLDNGDFISIDKLKNQ